MHDLSHLNDQCLVPLELLGDANQTLREKGCSMMADAKCASLGASLPAQWVSSSHEGPPAVAFWISRVILLMTSKDSIHLPQTEEDAKLLQLDTHTGLEPLRVSSLSSFS